MISNKNRTVLDWGAGYSRPVESPPPTPIELGSVSNALTTTCWVDTLAQSVVSKLSSTKLPVGGNPFSKLFLESGKISSDIFPKLKLESIIN